MTGKQYVGFGLGLAAIGLAILSFHSIDGAEIKGRSSTLVLVGVPEGVVLAVIGLVKILRGKD